MKFTNDHFLPSSLYDAISAQVGRDERRGHAEISVTEIINPPRIKQLMDRYHDQIEADISDHVVPGFGTAWHEFIARRSTGRSEMVLYGQWSGTDRTWITSGKVDEISEEDVLTDFKVCMTAEVDRGLKEEWEAQLNLYNKLVNDNGIEVAELQIVAFFRDWTQSGKYQKPGYPPSPVMPYKVRMWSRDSVEAYIQYRLTEHEKYFPMCTHQERWAEPDRWALMCEGRKTAVRLYETQREARIQMEIRRQAMPNKVWYLQERVAISKRCRMYCPVWAFCDYGQQERGSNLNGPP